MKFFLGLLNILGCLSLFLVVPLLVFWYLEFYFLVKVISIAIFIIAFYLIAKKTHIELIGIKILSILVITIVFSCVAHLIFGLIMELQTSKLVDEISSIETNMKMEPGDSYSNTIPKDSYENSIKFINSQKIFSKGGYGAKVNFKDGKSIVTEIIYFNPDHPIIIINNYNYMLY